MTITRHAIAIPLSALALLATTLHQPAKAIGGGVVLSQAAGITTVSASGTIVDPGLGFNYAAGQAVTFNFALANQKPPASSSWSAGGGDPFYFYQQVDYTALSGNTFTGTFDSTNTNAGTLTIYQSGRVEFDLASSNGLAYTGLQVAGSSSPQELTRYSLFFDVGHNFAGVPGSTPGSIPSIPSLLINAVGSYAVSSGEIVRANESKATYASTPAPLPILAVGVAFSHSRRLRKRLQVRQLKSC